MTLAELVEVLGGNVVQGSAATVLTGVNSSELAGPSELAFAEDAASAAEALAGNAGALVVWAGSAETDLAGVAASLCVVEDAQPRLWFARAAKLLGITPPSTGVHPSAVLGVDVEVGEDVTIGPCAFVGDHAFIGAGTSIEAGAVIGKGCISANIATSTRAPRCIPEPRLGIAWLSMPGRCWGPTGLGMCATTQLARIRSFRSRERW